ncbi:GGDEF domain-containing protein [Butyrivibrio sp. JL13D10]|uniref:GGDEF domain-containing protein n=1 Tax=Butyrivibrio sp. JL13D10 TaxID=3236815 RepID=UPI0038B47827
MTNYFNPKNLVSEDIDYNSFPIHNRRNISKYLNSILWICVLTGPAIATGIWLGIFSAVTYRTCAIITVFTFTIALLHFFIIKKHPDSIFSSSLALLALEILIAYMDYSHIDICITWFFVPLLSIFYCDIKIFMAATISNYIIMIISLWFSSPFYSQYNLEYHTFISFFKSAIFGLTIETVIMTITGYTLAKIARNYFDNLLQKRKANEEQIDMLNSQMKILGAMTGIYKYANLLDFNQMTEMSLLDTSYKTQTINLLAHAHSRMNHMLKRRVTDDYFEDFQIFTNMRTLRERLFGHSIIFGEFMDKETGWFRAQYIPVESDEQGVPCLIIYTVQDIDADKQREEKLINLSLTDALTGLYNRRCFEKDISPYLQKAPEPDLAILSIDLNRLKYANDTKGHAAGDELIRGAAESLLASICTCGKVYRIGGDEFSAIVHTDNVEELKNTIDKAASKWHGSLIDTLAMSIGYATVKDYPEADINELIKIADDMMYDEKNRYYIENGLDRRGKRN